MLHHFMEDLLPIVALPISFVALAWVIGQIIAMFRHRAHIRAQTEFHNRMLEKFGSASEFTAYLQSDAGKSFFDNLASEPATPLHKILGSIQKGTILTFLGLGLFILGKIFTEPQLDKFFVQPQGGNVMIILGVISFMIGAGFLASAAISYRLAKSWGMISVGNTRVSAELNSVQS